MSDKKTKAENGKKMFDRIVMDAWPKLDQRVHSAEQKVEEYKKLVDSAGAEKVLAEIAKLREENAALTAKHDKVIAAFETHKKEVGAVFTEKVEELISKLDGIKGMVKAKTGVAVTNGDLDLVAIAAAVPKLVVAIDNQDRQIADIETWLKSVDGKVSTLEAQSVTLHDAIKAPEGETAIADPIRDIEQRR